jgi:hypothetical protein
MANFEETVPISVRDDSVLSLNFFAYFAALIRAPSG